ncbi:MAG: DUF1269 domain-containing protein [bacterium]|nr:DUF1269 domain-containing protein [bacterium]
MSELIVIGFEDEFKAEEMRLNLLKMQKEYLIDLEDAVVAVKKQDGKIKLHQMHDLTAAGAAGGGFWGLLIGTLFLSPLFGAAIGAATGAVSGALSDIGINDDFMKELAATFTPGASALFVLVRKATPDKVLEEVKGYGGKILKTSLSGEKETALQAALDAAKGKAGNE